MRLSAGETRELLRSLDDPDHIQFPADHDQVRAAARFRQLATRLRDTFGDGGEILAEDATFLGELTVPSLATAGGRRIDISISNFGDLAIVSPYVPDALLDDAGIEALLHPLDASRVFGVLDDLGYVVIPQDPLDEYYDGAVAFLRERAARWVSRYFDYL
jgi:hypothetical protein